MQTTQAFVCMHIALQLSYNWSSLCQLVSGSWEILDSVFCGHFVLFCIVLVWFELLLTSGRLAKVSQLLTFVEGH